MNGTINSTDFQLPGLISKYEGKVRDVYELENQILVIVASDRISAFDIIMPKMILGIMISNADILSEATITNI